LKLVGGPKSPRDAIGAKVFLTAAAFASVPTFQRCSYGSTSDPASISFGRGRQDRQARNSLPSGVVEELSVAGVDRILNVTEGKELAHMKQ